MIHPGDIIAGSRMLDGSPSEIGFKVLKGSEVFSVPVQAVMELRTIYPEMIDLQIYMLAQSFLPISSAFGTDKELSTISTDGLYTGFC